MPGLLMPALPEENLSRWGLICGAPCGIQPPLPWSCFPACRVWELHLELPQPSSSSLSASFGKGTFVPAGTRLGWRPLLFQPSAPTEERDNFPWTEVWGYSHCCPFPITVPTHLTQLLKPSDSWYLLRNTAQRSSTAWPGLFICAAFLELPSIIHQPV